MVLTAPVLPGKNSTGEDITDAEQCGHVTDNLAHASIWDRVAIVVDTLDSEEPNVYAEYHCGLSYRPPKTSDLWITIV